MPAEISSIAPAFPSGSSFTLSDDDGVPAVEFVYPDETRARAAAKLLQSAIEGADVRPPGGA